MTKHEFVRNAIVKGLHEYMGILVIESSTIGNMPPYPFITYTITSPYLGIGYMEDYYEEENTRIQNRHVQHYERVFSFTIVANDVDEAMNRCMQAMQYFKCDGVWELKDKNIVIVEVNSATTRDTFITIDYERRYGFDVRIRLCEEEARETENIIETVIL